MKRSLIVAFTQKENGIGKNGKLPWKLKKDMLFFKTITIGASPLFINAVIMGRKTWESIPPSFRPLSDRVNIILSRNEEFKTKMDTDECKDEKIFVSSGLEEAFSMAQEKGCNECFVIGGEEIYRQALEKKLVDIMYTTVIYDKFDCDRVFPFKDVKDQYILNKAYPFEEENGIHYRFLTYYSNEYFELKRDKGLELSIFRNEEEIKALESMKKIIDYGQERVDRTGVGTRSLFGLSWKYNLTENFPLMTTKRMFFRGIFEELSLYMSGKTDNKILQDKKIHIWDGNTSREFLDKRGLSEFQEGDMGETYGFNMRHYGAEYKGCQHDYTGEGYDQLQNVLDLIRNDPSSRRMLINLWNPATTHKAALPSCMMQYQFYVRQDIKQLNLQVYLRSSDYFLANNWNVCTGALLVHLICNLEDIDLTPGELTVVTGDTHIYLSHLKAATENINRNPRPFPKLIVKENKKRLQDFTYEDIKLIGYEPYPSIKAEMAV